MSYDSFNPNYITLDLYLHVETDRALLVSEDDNRLHAVWVPLSQITEWEEIEDLPSANALRRPVSITMSEWIAGEKGLI